MTETEARSIFNSIAAAHRAAGNHDAAVNIELTREYCCNPTFRKALEEYMWGINQAKGR